MAPTAGGKDNVSVVFAEGPRFATEWRRGPTTGPVVNPPAVTGAERIDGRGSAAGARAPASRADAGPAAKGAGLATRDARARHAGLGRGDASPRAGRREWTRRRRPRAGAVAPATAVRAMASRWWQSRWIQFALGGACGAAIALAVPMLASPDAIGPPASRPCPRRARSTSVAASASASPTRSARRATRRHRARRPGGLSRARARLESGVHLVAAVPRQAVLSPAPDGTALVAVVGEGPWRQLRRLLDPGGAPSPIDVGVRLNDAAGMLDDLDVSGARVAGVVFEGAGGWRRYCCAPAPSTTMPAPGVIVRAGATARLAHNHVVERAQRADAGARRRPRARRARRADFGNVSAGNGGAARHHRGHARVGAGEQPVRRWRPRQPSGGGGSAMSPLYRRIGDYEIRGAIGSGGMADVFVAEDARTGVRVAPKVPRQDLDAPRRARRRAAAAAPRGARRPRGPRVRDRRGRRRAVRRDGA